MAELMSHTTSARSGSRPKDSSRRLCGQKHRNCGVIQGKSRRRLKRLCNFCEHLCSGTRAVKRNVGCLVPACMRHPHVCGHTHFTPMHQFLNMQTDTQHANSTSRGHTSTIPVHVLILNPLPRLQWDGAAALLPAALLMCPTQPPQQKQRTLVMQGQPQSTAHRCVQCTE